MKRPALKRLRLPWKRLAYPAILAVYVLIVLIVLSSSARFLMKNLNHAFRVDESQAEAQLIRLDLDGFRKLADNFGVPLNE